MWHRGMQSCLVPLHRTVAVDEMGTVLTISLSMKIRGVEGVSLDASARVLLPNTRLEFEIRRMVL